MTVLVIGSIALDTLETPFGRAEELLGGAGSYFSLAARLAAWHLGQCRSRQELYDIRVYPQRPQASTCPPKAAVRQVTKRRITAACSADTGWRAVYASPWARRMSATSSSGRVGKGIMV